MIEKEQDVHLDDMLSSLQRLGMMGQQVGEELDQHRVLLSNLNEDMDETGDRMENVMRKLDKLLGTSSMSSFVLFWFGDEVDSDCRSR